MDPISAFGVISGAFQIAQVITETAAGLATLRGRFNNADLTIRSLIGELTTIKSAITQLDDWARFNARDSTEYNEYDEGLDVALDGCRAVMDVLSEEVSTLTKGASANSTGLGFGTRVRVLWNEDTMRSHQDRLRAQVLALQLLLQACQCRSSSEQIEMLRRADNRRIIRKVADDTATLRTSRSYAASRVGGSSMSQCQSSNGETIFEFDRTVVASLPYRRALQHSRSKTETLPPLSIGDQSRSTDEGYGSGLARSPEISRSASLIHPVHPLDSVGPVHGHSKSVMARPNPPQQHQSNVRRWQSDSMFSPRANLSSGSRREKIRSVFRQLSRSNSTTFSSQVPARSPTGGSATGRQAQDRDVHTSINLSSPDGASAPLIVKTAQSGSQYDVERLIETGHDIEARHFHSRRNALLVASHCGNKGVVDLLIQKNARLDVADGSGSTALHLAASRGHCDVLELLLLENIDIEACNSNGWTSLWLAADRGHAEATRLLIDNHAKVNARADGQMTALHTAAKRGNKAVVEALLFGGADLAAKDGTMMTALHYACELGDLDIVELLLDNKADINTAGSDRRTPLICAAATGRLPVVQLLLKRKASARHVDDASMTAIHWAAFNGHTEIVDLLSRKKGSLEMTNIAGRTILHLAVINSQFAVVELLLRKKIQLESRCLSGIAPLHYACMADNTEIVKLLLISGADIEVEVEGDRRRPVHVAASRGSMALLDLLCEKGASLEARDAKGDRALCVACRHGHVAAVQNLLNRRSALYVPSGSRTQEDSPLCLAAMGGHLPVVTLLLQHGASVLKRDEFGRPPFYYAAHYGHPDVLQLLLSCQPNDWAKEGADVSLMADRIGFAPAADISEDRKREIWSLLRKGPSETGALPSIGGTRQDTSRMTPGPLQIQPFQESFGDPQTYTRQATTPQELPGTLEQGLPPSRSHTPEQMHRAVRPIANVPGSDLAPGTPETNGQPFAAVNGEIAMPNGNQLDRMERHRSAGPPAEIGPGLPYSGAVFLPFGESYRPLSTVSSVSVATGHLETPQGAGQFQTANVGARQDVRELGYQSSDSDSLSSVYTAPEGAVELAA